MAEISNLGQLFETYLTPQVIDALVSRSVAKREDLHVLRVNFGVESVSLDRLMMLLTEMDIDPDQILFDTTVPITFVRAKFVDRLKTLRVRRGMTPAALAQESGIVYNTYMQYESGRRVPSYPAVVKLAKALEVSVSTFAECDFGKDEEDSETKTRQRLAGQPNKKEEPSTTRRYLPPPADEEDDEPEEPTGTDEEGPIPF